MAYLTLPGTAGNYISTADVNLLDADTAHFHQSVGQWEEGAGSTTTAPTQSQALTPIYGDYHGQWIADGATSWMRTAGSVSPDPGYVAASPATQYTASAYVAGVVAGGATIEIRFAWYDSGFTALGNSSVTQIAVPATFTQIAITATSPASTAFFTIQLVGRSATNGDIFYVDAVQASQGSDASFVPSLRIVGDLDMRAKLAITDATPASAETLIGQRSGNSGYAMTIGTGGELVVYYGTGSGTRTETSSGLSLVADTVTVLRSYFDLSAGTWYHLQDGVQFDSSGSFSTTAGSPYAGPLAAGADSAGTSGNLDGDLYYIEVRDGIDGPVVARMDADDWVGI